MTELPVDAVAAARRLASAHVPQEILEVAQRLQAAGHAAVLVGGSVRDVLMGLPAADWDLASSAQPHEVQGLFRRTVATGIEHGTVTVLVRAGGETAGVEVTTFRGEGAYIDGRRPSAVTFHRDLIEDLARRDFTVNAFAWDPVAREFSDPFDGLTDLRRGLLRAVGEPARRFGEDGLRTMRAVRLCATRELELESATAAAIGGALEVLARVSRERVHVELVKLLAAPCPSRGLLPMAATGIWPLVLPPIDEPGLAEAIAAVDALPCDAVVRLARLLWPHIEDGRAEIDEALGGLRHGRAERARLTALLGPGVLALRDAAEPVAIRRAAALLGREHLNDALALLGSSSPGAAAVGSALAGAALTIGELAVRGRDLVEAGIAAPGPALGRLLASLLALVIEDPTRNTPATLLDLARSVE